MSLLTWDAARPWAKAMASQVAAGTMPPWHAAAEYGRFGPGLVLNAKEDRRNHRRRGCGGKKLTSGTLHNSTPYGQTGETGETKNDN